VLHFGTKATYELKTSFLYSQVDLEFFANGTRATRMSYVRTYEGAISQNAYKMGGGGGGGGSPPRHAITSSYVRGMYYIHFARSQNAYKKGISILSSHIQKTRSENFEKRKNQFSVCTIFTQ